MIRIKKRGMRLTALLLALTVSAAGLLSLGGCGGEAEALGKAELPGKSTAKGTGTVSQADPLLQFCYTSAGQLFKESQPGNNQVYSPVSAYLALSMLAEITGGDTRAQILTALGGAKDIEQVRQTAGEVFSAFYRDEDRAICQLADSAWITNRTDYSFRQETIDILTKKHHASLFSVDFESGNTPKQISKWVRDNTGGHLGKDPNAFRVSRDTVMLLFNALYFKMAWDEKLRAADVQKTFNLTSGEKVEPAFMQGVDSLPYGETGDATVSKWNFEDDFSMVFILPNKGIDAMEFARDAGRVSAAMSSIKNDSAQWGDVTLIVPKFDFTVKNDLIPVAKALGIEHVFSDPKADFSPLVQDQKPLEVNAISQQAMTKIDEEGCEAAAVTEVRVGATAAMQEERKKFTLRLDRPFLFAIQNDKSQVPLFIGVVNDPMSGK